MDIILNSQWESALSSEMQKSYFKQLIFCIDKDIKDGYTIYPPVGLIFNAFNLCPLGDIKIVILGQDPYINENEAMGLSFSVPNGCKCPPSLRNIFKEVEQQNNIKLSGNTDLSIWAKQGVLLLNSILTVRKGQSASHKNIGWERFTDCVISYLSNSCNNIVFMLWGNYARSKSNLIDSNKHLVLICPHPSPLARGGFFNNNHFVLANNFLISKGLSPIDWSL